MSGKERGAMYTVYKYHVGWQDGATIKLPVGAKILSFQNQGETPVIWALVDLGEPQTVLRRFIIRGTGHKLGFHPACVQYIGTAQFEQGALIWHLFEQLVG